MTLDRKSFLRHLGAGAAGMMAAAGVRAGGAAEAGAAEWPPRHGAGEPRRYWDLVRSQYEISDSLVYLNCGGLGPSPRPVLDVLNLTARSLQRRVEAGHDLFEEARVRLAGFLGATVEEIGFTRNATEGNSIIAAGLDLRAGDEVVFESHAHPGGSLPWLNQAKRRGITVRVFAPEAVTPEGLVEKLAAQLSPRTRVIQVSHVTAPTGVVMPVAAIARLARERGLWFHVDGAQSAGMIPVDLRAIGCDSYAASGHKWLGGPRETGVLFVRRERIEEVAPSFAGAYSSGDFDFHGRLEYAAGVRRHEYGTRDAAAVAALAAAVGFHGEIGSERIAGRGAELAARVRAGLMSLPGVAVLTPAAAALRASMLTFQAAGYSAARVFGHLLNEHHLRCRPVTEEGLEAVRVSTHIFNTEDECDRLIAAVAGLVARA